MLGVEKHQMNKDIETREDIDALMHSFYARAINDEVVALRKKLREVEMERDILKVSIAGSPQWNP